MADKTGKKKKKTLLEKLKAHLDLRKLREGLLAKSKGGKGGRPGLEQIEELMSKEEKKKKR